MVLSDFLFASSDYRYLSDYGSTVIAKCSHNAIGTIDSHATTISVTQSALTLGPEGMAGLTK